MVNLAPLPGALVRLVTGHGALIHGKVVSGPEEDGLQIRSKRPSRKSSLVKKPAITVPSVELPLPICISLLNISPYLLLYTTGRASCLFSVLSF